MIDINQTDRAREILDGLRGAVSPSEHLRLESEILSEEGRFQDAIDRIHSIPDKMDFDERHSTSITFLMLKMEAYKKAYTTSKTYLGKHKFRPSLQVDIINYEFAGSKTKNSWKTRKGKLTDFIENPNSKAIATLLCGDPDSAFEILTKEADIRFSRMHFYLKWPVLGELRERLSEYRTALLKDRRSLS